MRVRTTRRKTARLAAVCFGFTLFTAAPASAQPDATEALPLQNYQLENDYLPQSPSVTGGAVGAFGNPASWATAGRSEWAFWWDDRSVRSKTLDNWGLSFGKNLGFAYNQRTVADTAGTATVRDYQAGLAFGDRRNHFGIAWRIPGGDHPGIPREHALAVGTIGRPNRWLSYGLSGLFSTDSDARLGVADIGIRPFGKPWLTVFGDYSLSDDQTLEEGFWGAGFEARPWHGIHLGLKARETEGEDDVRYTLNVGLTFDERGTHVMPGMDEDGDFGKTTFLVRNNVPYRGIPARGLTFDAGLVKQRFYVPVNLEKKALTYQRDRWFDEGRVAWIDLARDLDRWKDDPSVRGVAVNISDARIPSSIAWELRKKLGELRTAGKEVIVHADRMNLIQYYVASCADRVTLDPVGDLTLAGLAMHRTYLKGFFEKAGLGVEEWRFFTYKSAFEGFARKDMSEPDREQRQRVVDVVYETVREAVCFSRKIAPEQFDAVVEDDGLLLAPLAVERKLVDAEARWHELGEWLEKERDGAKLRAPRSVPGPSAYPDEVWGRPRQIAIVYAIGDCAMDTGIKGRATSKFMRGLAKRKNVAGVVLRADSPGGDPLPSDLVAEATRKIKEAKKPVIVSQGNVAASGGYWISMDADTILTTPLTITGSIGVIGGWIWNDGFSEKFGFTADGVQRGSHADLLTGINVPVLSSLVGAPLPERNLDAKEKGILKERILTEYDYFVKRVAAGRGLSEARVREIGEGRVWMGGDAIDRNLADGFGGLLDAVDQARKSAGLSPDDEVEVVEYPERRAFSWPSFGPEIPWLRFSGHRAPASGLPFEGDDELSYWRALAASRGAPLFRIPLEHLPPGWEMRP